MQLDKIIELVKGQVSDTVTRDSDIPADKKEQAVDATTSSLIDGFKQYLTPDHLSSLASLLGTGGASADGEKAAQVSDGLQSNVISNLISKVGLSRGTSQKIASSVVPAVMALFTRKLKDGDDPDFNIGSLLGGMGKNSKDDSGILDKIGSFFNRG